MRPSQWLSMRQRLLLVAGWVLAAVGTSVVASAAVAVAGGQVNERPLRPLTAAEVAALPDGYLSDLLASESLASGDSSIRATQPAGEATGPDRSGSNPAGAEGDLPFDGIDPDADLTGPYLVPSPTDGFRVQDHDVPEVTEPDPVSEPVEPPSRSGVVEHAKGGSVSAAFDGERLTLLWATPRFGWFTSISFEGTTKLTVQFSDGTETSTITIEVIDDGLAVNTVEAGV